MKNDNLHDSQIRDLLNRVRNLETRSPMRSASVTDGNTNFIGNESLTVAGSQKVSGWLIVTGTLKLVGTLLLEGIINLTGSMLVKAGGSVTVEGTNPITIGQSAGAAAISMSSAKLYGTAAGGVFGTSAAVVSVTSAGPSMTNLGGSASVTVGAARTVISGGLDLQGLPTMTKGALVPNLYQDPTTKIVYRLV